MMLLILWIQIIPFTNISLDSGRNTPLRTLMYYNACVYVIYDGIQSEVQSVKCGLRQGSILDPLLFIAKMNDLYNV